MNELIETKKKSEILAEEIFNRGYGNVITHKEIENIIQEEYGSKKYNSEIARTKKIALKKYNRCIESIRGDGYRIISPDDFTTHSLKHYKRGFKELQKGKDVLDYAPTKDMSQEGLITYRRVNDRSVLLVAAMEGAKAELKSLNRAKSLLDPDNINRK